MDVVSMFERDEWNERRRTEGKEGGRGGSRSCTVSFMERVGSRGKGGSVGKGKRGRSEGVFERRFNLERNMSSRARE